MIKANHAHTAGWKILRGLSISAIASLGLGATSSSANDSEPLSAIGIERGLELYDSDAADICVLGHHQIRVTVNNVSREGILKLELFGEKNFMKRSGKLRNIRVPAEDGPMRVCINLYGPGEYAVVGYHDKDADRSFDKKWNFSPKEPYGLSNNPEIRTLRLPKWEETKFDVPADGKDIVINLVDPD